MVGGGHTLTPHQIKLPHKHTHLIFDFEDKSRLFFNDVRKFGYIKKIPAKNLPEIYAQYGIEPLTKNYTQEAFSKIFKNRKTTLKALLLNQKNIAGLGNIYVDEACFRSGIRPDRLVKTLTKTEIKKLFENCALVLDLSIKAGGTTFYNFTHSDGKSGNYFQKLQVFARAGKPCRQCGSSIQKIKIAGRGTHLCPQCQK